MKYSIPRPTSPEESHSLTFGNIMSLIFKRLVSTINILFFIFSYPFIVAEIFSKGQSIHDLVFFLIMLVSVPVIFIDFVAALICALRRKRIVIYYASLLAASAATFFLPLIIQNIEGVHTADFDFVLVDKQVSNDSTHTLIKYMFDIGAIGYTRLYWTVIPNGHDDENLKKYILPDGYEAMGWSDDNELLVQRLYPDYNIEKHIELNSGDLFKGVKIILLPDSDSTRRQYNSDERH